MIKIGEDRWIWIGLGIVTFITVRTVSHQLQQIRELTQVKDDQQRPTMIDQTTEDGQYQYNPIVTMLNSTPLEALKLDTLQRLADGPVYELRVAATKIICERAAAGPTFSLLLQNVSSPDSQVRGQALVALKYLCRSPSFPKIINYPTFHAVVTALEHCLKDPSRSTLPQRSPPERHAMWIMSAMLPHDISLALKAGIVKRWLAHYPFGRTEAETHEAIKKLRTYSTDDRVMSAIVAVLENHPEGRKQMRLAGLTGSSIGETGDEYIGVIGLEEAMVMEESLATRRLRDDTLEERMIRRRRREAIVVSDGRQPLGRGDIIQRHGTGLEDDDLVESASFEPEVA